MTSTRSPVGFHHGADLRKEFLRERAVRTSRTRPIEPEHHLYPSGGCAPGCPTGAPSLHRENRVVANRRPPAQGALERRALHFLLRLRVHWSRRGGRTFVRLRFRRGILFGLLSTSRGRENARKEQSTPRHSIGAESPLFHGNRSFHRAQHRPRESSRQAPRSCRHPFWIREFFLTAAPGVSEDARMFKKILIANRGEIACRVIRSCRDLGLKTVCVYSEADQYAPHVLLADEAYPIGPAPSAESYLVGEKILAVAQSSGADAIHPGYGLSENPDFRRACEKAGVGFVGPSAEAMEAMGEKTLARETMAKAGVPIVPRDRSPAGKRSGRSRDNSGSHHDLGPPQAGVVRECAWSTRQGNSWRPSGSPAHGSKCIQRRSGLSGAICRTPASY